MNPNIQGPLPLEGRGYVYRPNGRYELGEYEIAENIDLTNRGTLVNRNSVAGAWWQLNDNKLITEIVGSFGSNPIAASPDTGYPFELVNDFLSTESNSSDYDTFSDLLFANRPVVGTGFANERIQFHGFFVYNNREYFICTATYRPQGTGTDDNDQNTFVIVASTPAITSYLRMSPMDAFTEFGTVLEHESQNNIHVDPANDYAVYNQLPRPKVKDWLIHKERLWLVIGDTVYFSAATEPDNFTVPQGGFFRFPTTGGGVRAIASVGDIIYVISDTSVSAITYSTDPNLDAKVSVISDAVGGEDAAVHGDTVYLIKPNSLYAINGNNVTKVLDLDFNIGSSDVQWLKWETVPNKFTAGRAFDLKMVAFEDALYILPRYCVPLGVSGIVDPYQIKYINSAEYGSVDEPLFKINLNNGFVSVYSFGSNGKPCDLRTVGTEDSINQTRLCFTAMDDSTSDHSHVFTLGSRSRYFTSKSVPGTGNFPGISTESDYNMDTYCPDSDNDNLFSEIPYSAIKISHFSPDNMRYLLKKFRSMEIDLNVPTRWDGAARNPAMSLEVFAGIDPNASSSVISTTVPSTGYTTTEDNIPETLRYGFNQKCKHISVIIEVAGYNYNAFVTDGDNKYISYPRFEISDIRALWSYTGRGPTNAPSDES